MSSEEDEQTKKKLVGVRITESRRHKWKDFVAESEEYGSMADMMRTGVRKVMAEGNEKDGNGMTQEQKLDRISDRQVRLIKSLENFREENKELFENIDGARETAEEVIHLQQEINSDTQEEK